jgi:hypothetical protein
MLPLAPSCRPKRLAPLSLCALIALTGLAVPQVCGAELVASDGADFDNFGQSVSLSGTSALVGAYGDDDRGSNSGSAYVFRNIDTGTGSITQNVKLTASDGAAGDNFGRAVSLSGQTALVAAANDDDRGTNAGAAYVFRNLNIATGSVTQNVKLTASDGAANDNFGKAVSLSGQTALVGADFDDDRGISSGSAYVFRNIDTATGSITQNVKLTASDGAANDNFGSAVSLSGQTALVGAAFDNDRGSSSGSAYVFRNIDTATGSITQNAKLTASDGAADDRLGFSVSLSGQTALLGSFYDNVIRSWGSSNSGSAYVFRDLETASGTITQNVKLIASDGTQNDFFGYAVSLSGQTALVGAYEDDDKDIDSGSAYVFQNLDSASGTITQNVKLTASDAGAYDYFGSAVSIDGDHFVVGASNKNSSRGKAYTGTVSSLTTLDTGNASRVISGISFVSQDNWIIGRATDENHITLSAGDTANVTAAGKAIYIGQEAGSDLNTLFIEGHLAATTVYIGAVGNLGNRLVLDSTATFGSATFRLSENNFLDIEGDRTDIGVLFDYLGGSTLQVWKNAAWLAVTELTFDDYLHANFDGARTRIAVGAIPEPSAFAALAGLAALGLAATRRRLRA